MFWTHGHRLARRAGAFAALALFVLGSNFCLLGAVRGAPICTAFSAGSAGATAAPTGHCPRHAGNSAPTRARAVSPCCVSLTPTSAPDVPRVDAAALPLMIGLAVASLDDAPRVVLAHPPLDDGSPVSTWEKTVRAGRAPPLA